MAYTEFNFRTKSELRKALDEGKQIRVYQPGLGTVPENGTVYLEGPHYPQPHTWYAKGTMVEGFLEKVE